MKEESCTRPGESFHGHPDSSVAALLASRIRSRGGPLAAALGSNQSGRERIHLAVFNVLSSFIVHLGITLT